MAILKFLGALIGKIGEWFSSLVKGANKVWDNLEPEVQTALVQASGIVDIINKYSAEAPDFILKEIQAAFPKLPLEKVQAIIAEIDKDLNLTKDSVNPDPLVTLKAISDYLASHSGSKWARVSENIATGIALFLAPSGTPWNKIGTIMWWVYQTFIKK